MKDLIVLPNITIKQALKKISQSGEKCLLVINKNNNLLGTLSDGDLRKSILKGIAISEPINSVYNPKPAVLVESNFKLTQAKKLFLNKKYDLIPIINKKGILVDVLVWEKVFKNKKKKEHPSLNIPVVIMAGGRGTRMEPFTKVLPKPLIPIHEKPVIEHIIEQFTTVGVNKFVLTVNYKAQIMKAFFEELSPDYSVEFIEEKKPLGTAGSLKFLEGKYNESILVTNCDIIIKTNYIDLYKFHQKNNYDITLVASMKNYTIPYGTCELNTEGHLKQINEKPEFDFLVNTGLYALNPDVLRLIPEGKMYHITQLIDDAKKGGMQVGVYPIDDDSWIDVGQWAEYQKAVEQL